MVWIAVVLGVFLFYKLVERKHKIAFFKATGVVIAVGLLGLAGLLAYEKLTAKPHYERIRISYQYHLSKVPTERRIQIANGLFETFEDNDPLTKNLGPEERNFLKDLFYDQVHFESAVYSQYVGATEEETTAAIDSVFEDDPKNQPFIRQGREGLAA